MSRLEIETENTLKKIELDTCSKRQYSKEHFEKKLCQYIDKWRNDINIQISFLCRENLQIPEKFRAEVQINICLGREKKLEHVLAKKMSLLT